ncbi:MAG: PIN domain-containing protein [Bifidobacteriaceae bacterium]|jgi:PIN domain nuclease of toxin-antitoxin system|nr:PIN domain-containing protein [Bifidobacteriaceae bacterium]
MTVLDASAILAWLLGEPGADAVEEALTQGAVCSAANWSEVAQKSIRAGQSWRGPRALLLSYDLGVEAVTAEDAEWAARRWRQGEGLSLADRLCLALAARLGTETLTADTQWGTSPGVRQIR